MSSFLSWYIIAITVLSIVASAWLLLANARIPKGGETTGHVWDGDLEEYNNPLPRWWLWLFIGTIVFAGVYFALYPGLGKFEGTLGWSQVDQWKAEVAEAEANQADIFAAFEGRELADLASDGSALAIGRSLFANNCAMCHGSDARGARGFPNLTDDDWLWGGEPQQVLTSVLNGRNGVMPAGMVPEAMVDNMVEQVRSLSGLEHDASAAAAAAPLWAVCGACHGMDGGGNIALGAPNLKDSIWLYGSDRESIAQTITMGRQNNMPAQKDLLGEDKARLVAAYVLSLSAEGGSSAE